MMSTVSFNGMPIQNQSVSSGSRTPSSQSQQTPSDNAPLSLEGGVGFTDLGTTFNSAPSAASQSSSYQYVTPESDAAAAEQASPPQPSESSLSLSPMAEAYRPQTDDPQAMAAWEQRFQERMAVVENNLKLLRERDLAKRAAESGAAQPQQPAANAPQDTEASNPRVDNTPSGNDDVAATTPTSPAGPQKPTGLPQQPGQGAAEPKSPKPDQSPPQAPQASKPPQTQPPAQAATPTAPQQSELTLSQVKQAEQQLLTNFGALQQLASMPDATPEQIATVQKNILEYITAVQGYEQHLNPGTLEAIQAFLGQLQQVQAG